MLMYLAAPVSGELIPPISDFDLTNRRFLGFHDNLQEIEVRDYFPTIHR